MAYDAYLFINTIEGESLSTIKAPAGITTKKPLELYSFSFGASNPVTIGSQSTGAGAGKVSLSSFNAMKKTDSASPLLFAACAKGSHIDKASVVLRKAGGDAGQSIFLEYDFSLVYIESIQWSGSTGGDDTPTESVSIAYGAVKIQYFAQDDKGVVKLANVAMWSAVTNTATEAVK